ncbi:MAG TPA: hypothetical protein VH088_10120 [Terriglobales bacterium]|nr:hypothetical protein [Terriglobales bacterium]
MNIKRVMTEIGIAILVAGSPAISAPKTNTSALTQTVITVRPPLSDNRPDGLEAADLTVLRRNIPVPVIRLERLSGTLADMQLFVLLDESSRSSSLGVQLPELKTFLKSLPTTTQVAIGYMRNGTFGLVQPFTADHEKSAHVLRLPTAIPGENGSPYFALSDLAKHWPAKQSSNRRAVLMLTDGVDRYYDGADPDDPYVNAAIHDALKENVMVYSIYLRGAGLYGRSAWGTNVAQSRLEQVSEETGGYAYSMGFTDPVTITPFLKDFQNRLNNQYRVTVEELKSNEKGVQPVKLRSELRGVKIEGPTRIYVR